MFCAALMNGLFRLLKLPNRREYNGNSTQHIIKNVLTKEQMSIHLKKKSKLYKILENNQLLDLLFFGFLINDFESILVLDKIVHHALLGRIRSHANKIGKQFKSCHEGIFELLDCESGDGVSGRSQKLKIMVTGKKETKIYFPLRFKLKGSNSLKQQQVYNISYSHKLERTSHYNKKKTIQHYVWNSQFYLPTTTHSKTKISKKLMQSPADTRKLWIYHQIHSQERDFEQKQNNFNSSEHQRSTGSSSNKWSNKSETFKQIFNKNPTFSVDTIPLQQRDLLRLNIPFYSNGHPVFDLNFYPLEEIMEKSDRFYSGQEVKKGKQCELQSIYPWKQSTLEELFPEALIVDECWEKEESLGKEGLEFCSLSQIVRHSSGGENKGRIFSIISVKTSGVHEKYRLELKILRPGWKLSIFGVNFQSVREKEQIEVVLRKRGCYDDEGSCLPIRTGQIIIIYFIRN